MAGELRDLEIPRGKESAEAPRARERLDRFVAEALGASRAEARRLLESGAVLVNGRAVGRNAKSRPVATRDRVQLRAQETPGDSQPRAEPDLPLTVLARGAGWVALDKPAGCPVHPYRADEAGTVLGALLAREPQLLGVGEGGLRSGVVHRLDVETSGVLLFALDADTWSAARRAFETGAAKKRYRALVAGRLEGEGDLTLDLYVAQHRPARVRVAEPGFPKRSWRTALHWRAVETFVDATLVEVAPRTGFLHQIRVSLAELGHPVLGDQRYGAGPSTGRHYLHAASLEIAALGGMRAQSPDPADFCAALAALRSGGRYSEP